MGAGEILNILMNGDKLTSTEIADKLNSGLCSVQFTIKRLLKDSSVKILYRPLTPEEKKERFGRGIGARINIYWIDE